MPRDFFEPALARGIGAFLEQVSGFVSRLARFRQTRIRICPESDGLAPAGKPVVVAPQLAAARLDQKIEAGAVRDLVGSRLGFGRASGEVGERHVTVPVGVGESTVKRYRHFVGIARSAWGKERTRSLTTLLILLMFWLL